MSIQYLEKLTNILKFNYANLLAIIIILMLFPVLVFSHGGDDHDDQGAAIPVAQNGKLNTKLAKTSHAEILLKYPTPTIGVETQLRVFITDINTNSPVEDAKVSLIFSFLNTISQKTNSESSGVVYANTNEFQLDAVASNISGVYQVPVTFPKSGSYQIKLKITGSNIDVSASISGVVVNQAAQITSDNRKIFWLLASAVFMLLVIRFGWVWYRRRRGEVISTPSVLDKKQEVLPKEVNL